MELPILDYKISSTLKKILLYNIMLCGIIGTILVFAPYFVLIGLYAYKVLKSKFRCVNIINLLAVITIIFIFGIAYMSGNLFNSLSFTIYFTLLFALLKNVNT